MQFRSLDEAALAAAYRRRAPFPFVVIDDLVVDPDALLAIVDDEGLEHYQSDIFAFDATAPALGPDLSAVRDRFTTQLAPVLARITGLPLARADLRAFAYRAGHYLLPHTDHQESLGRLLAYAYYLPSPDAPTGGELELYRAQLVDGELTAIESVVVIEPRPNRIALFEVSPTSLHQVREVLTGLRVSLAGWFYA